MSDDDMIRLHWMHPVLGEIDEVVCRQHRAQVRGALEALGIGCIGSDGSVPVAGVTGPGEIPACLRCQAHPAMPTRVLLRQWFGEASR